MKTHKVADHVPEWKMYSDGQRRCRICKNRNVRKYQAGKAYKTYRSKCVWAKHRDYRKGAKKRNLEFSLDLTLFTDLITDSCFWCGNKPNPLNGIDRVDNSKGYVSDNVVSCCGECNMAKGSLTTEAWMKLVGRLIGHWGDEGIPPFPSKARTFQYA